ncbi:MAG: glycosyltransferase family 4 protein [Planctomycetota bacterium]
MTSTRRIWASLDDYVLPPAGLERVGLNMANNFFFRALMRHGTFDEYHFFLANSAHRNLFMEKHGPFLEEVGVTSKIRLLDRLDLMSLLRQVDYTVFHQSDHISLFNSLCCVRNSLGARVPVTSFIHSVSYQRHMGKYLEMATCGSSENDAIICSSNCGKQVLSNCFSLLQSNLQIPTPKVQLRVIPLGIDQGVGRVEKSASRQGLKLNDNEIIALCFGRFSDFDKMDLFPLLQAFIRANPNGKPWRLILAGALHEPTYLEMARLWTKALKLSDNVTFIVDPSDDAKSSLYGAADFFISIADNVQETFGLTLLEAMDAGLPLLVSDFDGYRELCSDEVGIRVPTRWGRVDQFQEIQAVMDERTAHRLVAQSLSVDVPSLAKGMETLFSNQQSRQKMSTASRTRFEEHFDHKRLIGALESLWDELKVSFEPVDTRPDPMSMRVFDTFGHYVTGFTKEDDVVVASHFGTMLRESGNPYPLLTGMSDVVDWSRVVSLLTAAAKPISMKNLMNSATDQNWKTWYTMAWMLKHDLLERVESASQKG